MNISYYFSQIDLLDYLIVTLNLLLMVSARSVLLFFHLGNENSPGFVTKVHSFRALNLLIILTYGYSNIYATNTNSGFTLKLISIWVIIYLAYLVKQIISYWIRINYGKLREINGAKKSTETYTSRLFSLLSGVVIFIIALISCINVLEMNNLLHAGGVIGIIGVFLALTQNSWAPDIISGLILLNNGIIEEGDVIEIDDNGRFIGVIYKTKIFHTEILDLVNNHRIMLKNSRLREFTIQNLSKFASAKGLREKLSFKIGYDVSPAQVRKMVELASIKATHECGNYFDTDNVFDVAMVDAGDHAIEWAVFYYTKDVKSLIKIRQAVRECILLTALESNISLATPITLTNVKEETN